MKNYIIGNGGFAKEVYSILNRNNIHFDGFIGLENKSVKIGSKTFISIIESDFIKCHLNANLYIGIGNPTVLKTVKTKYKNFNFPNLIDKDAKILGEIDMGEGNIICANSIFTTAIQIGSFNIFNLGCNIGHDCVINDCNVFNPTSCVSGNVKIGNNNLFGVNSTILQNVTIHDDNVIGAMALITKDITDNFGVYIGIPAKKMTF